MFTRYSGVFHLYDGGQQYGPRRKPGSAKWKSTVIRMLPEDGHKESQHKMDFNSQRQLNACESLKEINYKTNCVLMYIK